jgi:hypothetical protein
MNRRTILNFWWYPMVFKCGLWYCLIFSLNGVTLCDSQADKPSLLSFSPQIVIIEQRYSTGINWKVTIFPQCIHSAFILQDLISHSASVVFVYRRWMIGKQCSLLGKSTPFSIFYHPPGTPLISSIGTKLSFLSSVATCGSVLCVNCLTEQDALY